MSHVKRSPALVLAGLILMGLGALHPLELIPLILLGHVLVALGVWKGGNPTPRQARVALLPLLALACGLGAFIWWKSHNVYAPLLFAPVLVAMPMLEWGLRRGGPAEPRCVFISTGVNAVGVAVLFIVSFFGGIDEGQLSWWSLPILLYPLGWWRGLYSLGRWIAEGAEPSSQLPG